MLRPGLLMLVLLAQVGCRVTPVSDVTAALPTSLPGTGGLDEGRLVESVDALCHPPQGWIAQPLKKSSRHTHQIWISPSGKTAYGVIHFGLPFRVGYDLVLWVFMREMRRNQGEAELLSQQWDPNQRAMRFVAQGGQYTIRTNLMLRGLGGWAVYAGTLRGGPIVEDELDLAERAREHTLVGRDADAHSGK